MADEDDVHSSDDCLTLARPNQPESFIGLMGEHYVDPSRLEYFTPTQDLFQQHGRSGQDRAHETLQRPQQDFQQGQSPHQKRQTTYSQQEVEYMHLQLKLKSKIQELELLLRLKTEECDRAGENEKYWRTLYMDTMKSSSTNSNNFQRRPRSPSPIDLLSSPRASTRGRSPRSKKRRRIEHHHSTDRYNPLASLFPNGTNPEVSEPEDDKDELIIQYWNATQFDSKSPTVPQALDVDDTYQPCARKYSYFEDGTGRSITKSQLDQIRTHVTDVFVTLNNYHHDHIKGKGFWRELSKSLKDAFWKELRIKFPFLRYCNNNWKGQKFIVDYYRRWYVSIEKGQDASSGFKLEEDTGGASTSPVERHERMVSKLCPPPAFGVEIVRPLLGKRGASSQHQDRSPRSPVSTSPYSSTYPASSPSAPKSSNIPSTLSPPDTGTPPVSAPDPPAGLPPKGSAL